MSNRGQQFFEQAENKLNSFSFSKKKKIEESAQLFVNSGNAYKSVRDFNNAGKAYFRAAECFQSIDSLTDSASQAAEAANMYSRSPETREQAIQAYRFAVQIYRENCKATQAARLLIDASTLFLENKDLDSAAEALKDAILLYEDEKQPSTAATHITTLAEIRCQQKKWLEASELFRRVADIRLSQRLTQLSAGEFITKSVLCQLASNDTIGAEKLIGDFLSQSPGFHGSREHLLLTGIIDAIKKNDTNAYSQAVFDYDQIKRLDKWFTEVLLIMKKRLDEGEEEDIL